MKIETEIKLAVEESLVKDIVVRIEKEFDCKKSDPFHQITHQFFFEDYTKQNAFPRIRNEKDGSISLTVKAKLKENSEFFKRIELETAIGNAEKVINMMPFFGFPKKISWEKKRHSFLMNGDADICFFLDETPMGWFLEIEAEEEKIEEAITKLELQKAKRINKAYLGLWEEYKKEHGISNDDMMFSA
ncbi:MAG: CYTH domain-containing protein [bacterium]|nr:CYTH domain-containing protein [bacterium]